MTRGKLNLITAPAIELVTADEVKLHTRVDENESDSIIEIWIKTARAEAEKYMRRAYITQTWELSFDGWPCVPFDLPRPPLSAFKTIKYYATDNTETTLYDIDTPVGTESNFLIDSDNTPGRVTLAYGVSWPSTILRSINAVKVRYEAGYGTAASSAPSEVRDALLLYCAWRYENRTAEAGEMPEQFYNVLRPSRMHT